MTCRWGILIGSLLYAVVACGEPASSFHQPPLEAEIAQVIDEPCGEAPLPTQGFEAVASGEWRLVVAADDRCIQHRRTLEFYAGRTTPSTRQWICNRCDEPAYILYDFMVPASGPAVTLSPALDDLEACRVPVTVPDGLLCDPERFGGVRGYEILPGAGLEVWNDAGLYEMDAGATALRSSPQTIRFYVPRLWLSSDSGAVPDVSTIAVCRDHWLDAGTECIPDLVVQSEDALRFIDIELTAPPEWVESVSQ